MTAPSFAIIGAQKAATTTLQDALSRHPELELLPQEVTLFEEPEFAPDETSRQLVQLSAALPAAARIGFKRADSLSIPCVAGRLQRVLPEARLIAVLRHPVDRAVSAYHHFIRFGHIAPLALDDTIDALLNGSLEAVFPKAGEILPYGHYAEHLIRFSQHFDRDQILVLFQDELLSDPETSLHRTFDFLGVGKCPVELRRRNQGTYSMPALRLYYARTPWLFEFNNSRRVPKRRSVGDWMIGGGLTLVARLNARRGPVAAVSTATRHKLWDYYSPLLPELTAFLGRELPDSWRSGA